MADDHKRCPVGAHTHHVPLTSAEQDELMGLVKTMVDLSYLKMEDVPKIPRRHDAIASGRLLSADAGARSRLTSSWSAATPGS